MKKTFYPLVFLIYVMQALFIFSLIENKEDSILINISFGLAIVIFIYCLFVILHASLVKEVNLKETIKTTMIVKLSLVPFFIISMIICIILAIGSFIVLFYLPIFAIIILLALLFMYTIIITTSSYLIKSLLFNYKQNKIQNIIIVLLQFMFITDTIGIIYLYNKTFITIPNNEIRLDE